MSDRCGIEVRTRNPWLRQLTAEGLEVLSTPDAPARGALVKVTIDAVDPLGVPALRGRAVHVVKGGIEFDALVDEDNRSIRVRLGTLASVRVAFDSLSVVISIHRLADVQTSYDPIFTSSVLFKSFLLEVVPAVGLMPVHASMSAAGEHGVVVAGPPRSGKSRANLALVSAGCKLLGDELAFVRYEPEDPLSGQLELVAFPIRMKTWFTPGEEVRSSLEGTSSGAVVSTPRSTIIGMQQPRPRVLLVIDPALSGFAPEPLDAFDALRHLLGYDVFYARRWASTELAVFDNLAGSVRAWAVPSILVAERPDLIVDLVERTTGWRAN